MSFDLMRYREHKASGLIKVEKINGQTVITAKQFDRFTGAPLEDIPVQITDELLTQITQQRRMAQHLLDESQVLLTDVYGDKKENDTNST